MLDKVNPDGSIESYKYNNHDFNCVLDMYDSHSKIRIICMNANVEHF